MDEIEEHKKRYLRYGYTYLPNLVCAAALQEARNLIDGDFGRHDELDPEIWNKFSSSSFCPELVASEDLNFLATDTGAFAFAKDVIGCCCLTFSKPQVARRRLDDGYEVPHIDGFYSEGKGAKVNTPFAVLGIYLSDVMQVEEGPFTVWPAARNRVKKWAAPLDQLPMISQGQPNFSNLGPGTPVLGPSGTAFLVHGALPHTNTKRTTVPGFRDAVFFRLYCPNKSLLELLKGDGEAWPTKNDPVP